MPPQRTSPSPRKAVTCPECQREFTRSADVLRHMRTVHDPDVESRKISCSFPGCTYRTLERSNMKAHERAIHKGEYIPCDKGCGAILSSKSSLAHHRRNVHGPGYPRKPKTGTSTYRKEKTSPRDQLPATLLQSNATLSLPSFCPAASDNAASTVPSSPFTGVLPTGFPLFDFCSSGFSGDSFIQGSVNNHPWDSAFNPFPSVPVAYTSTTSYLSAPSTYSSTSTSTDSLYTLAPSSWDDCTHPAFAFNQWPEIDQMLASWFETQYTYPQSSHEGSLHESQPAANLLDISNYDYLSTSFGFLPPSTSVAAASVPQSSVSDLDSLNPDLDPVLFPEFDEQQLAAYFTPRPQQIFTSSQSTPSYPRTSFESSSTSFHTHVDGGQTSTSYFPLTASNDYTFASLPPSLPSFQVLNDSQGSTDEWWRTLLV